MPLNEIFPLTYPDIVYETVGRVTVAAGGPDNFVKLLNESGVLNFHLTANKDPRSLAFIHHMGEITEVWNSTIRGHQIIMAAAKAAMYPKEE